MFRREATRLCAAEGYETLTASTWSELNTTLSGVTPDIVLMDVDLPTIPGHRLASFVRVQHRIPIVLVSAFPEEKLRRLFSSSDADAWICKPLTRDKLVGAITRFVPLEKKTDASAPPATASHPAAGTGEHRRRILLVEDDPIISDRIAHVLTPFADVVMVSDGEAAIEKLWSESFDVILLDLMLPRLSGFDVIRHLMMHRPELLKATVVSSAATDQSLQFIDEKAVHRVVRKPFDVLDLAKLVQEM
jgi:CheY-like chemotaxis protein